MATKIKYLKLSALNASQVIQYKAAIKLAFPEIILSSKVMTNYWLKLENYFPFTQQFLVDENSDLIGFMNTIPIYWDQSLDKLPDEGWDWLLRKGIADYENKVSPNSLGGLQIIVRKEYQGKGFSKLLIEGGKKLVENLGYENFIIPIRPTFKHHFPEMNMEEYINFKKQDKIYDPWIRTHLRGGAKIINICKNSMNIEGDISFWEKLMKQKINSSGKYFVKGALNPVLIDVEKNYGEYREENIWISYS